MFFLLVFVLDNPELLRDLLPAWEEAGVPGATVLESTGLRRIANELFRDDVPLLPSLQDLTAREQAAHRTLFAVIDDEAIVERVIAATERVVGDLAEPHTGILFVVPVSRVVGGQRSRRPNTQRYNT